MESFKCGACDEALSDGVHCTVCNKELHFHCAGITEAGYRKLGDRKLNWRCNKCKQTGLIQQPSSPRIDSDSSLILKEIREIKEKLAPLEHLKEELAVLRSEFTEVRGYLSETNKELRLFNTKIKEMENRLVQVEKMQEQVNGLQAQIDKLEEESHANDQWTRINNIEIKGLPQTANENLFDMVNKIGAKIAYPITKTQINFLTRVPAREKDKTKSVIIAFCNRYVKEDFIAAAKLYNKKSPLTTGQVGLPGNQRIYINDHLTVRNKALLSKTKKVAAELDFRYVWVKHSKIHARKTDTSHVIILRNEQDLTKLK